MNNFLETYGTTLIFIISMTVLVSEICKVI